VHARGVETIHWFIKYQELRIAEQARGDTESLAHAHGVLRNTVIGAPRHTDALQRRVDSIAGRAFARGSKYLKVLPSCEVAVESRFIDDGPDAR
jgi:hypothetical protein